MVALVLLYLILISAGVAAVAFSKRARFEDSLLLGCSGIVVILFLCGIMGALEAGVYIILLSSLLVLVISAIYVWKLHKGFLERFFTPGFFYFTICYVVLIILHYGRKPYQWDEFSHWADVVKAMVSINDFSTSPLSHSAFQSYVPGMTLFQYFVQKLQLLLGPDARFQEWLLYFAYHVFSCSLILVFFKDIPFRKFLSGGLLFMVVCLSPTVFFSNYLTTVYIDPFVAIAAGSGFALLYARPKDPLLSVHVPAVLIILVLAKDVGMMFAIFLAIAAVWVKSLPVVQQSGIKALFRQKNLLFWATGIALAVILPKLLWNCQVAADNAVKNFSQPVDFAQLMKVWSGADQTYHTEVTKAFFQRFLTGKVPFLHLHLTYPLIFAILLAGCIVVHWLWSKKDEDEEKSRRVVLIVMVIQTAVYIIGLSILYLFKFTEYEAKQLASFDRYLGISFLGLLLMLALITISCIRNNPRGWYPAGCLLLAFVVLSLPVGPVRSFADRSSVTDALAVRAEYEDIASEMLEIAQNHNEHVYLVSQRSSGFDYWVLKYSIRPCTVNDNFTWSLTTSGPLYEGDVWSSQKTAEQWQTELDAYDYVLLYRIDETFVQDYASLFADEQTIAEQTIYAIDHQTGLLHICR
ncbi:MAG: DUF4173 domain-containing protein [Clostridia bacterium]|nr:DUF4173 domain-containing protein [Clostridia bacterium]